MPSYNQLATLHTSSQGKTIQSKYTVAPEGINFLYVLNNVQSAVGSMSEFRNFWLAAARRNTASQNSQRYFAFITLAPVFEDEGVSVDITSQLEDRRRTDTTYGFEFAIDGILSNPAGSEAVPLQFSAVATFNNFSGGVYGYRISSVRLINPTSILDIPSGGSLQDNVNRKVSIIKPVIDKQPEFLPLRAGFLKYPFWVRPDPLLGQFSQLIIGEDDLLSRKAVKTLRLECYYFFELGILSSLVEFGYEDRERNMPIQWKIAGTERAGNIVYLNLVTE